MRRSSKIFWSLILTISIIIIYGYYYLNYKFSLFDNCDSQEIATSTSPNSVYEAHHFIQNCGATSDFSTYIEIRDLRTRQSGKVIVIKGKNVENLDLNWTTDQALKVSFNGNPDTVFTFVNKFESANVILVNNSNNLAPK